MLDQHTKYAELRIWAKTFADVQKQRVAMGNRFTSQAVPQTVVSDLLSHQQELEHKVALVMRKSFRRAAPELVKWIKSDQAVGIGEHLVARFVGQTGPLLYAQPYRWKGNVSSLEECSVVSGIDSSTREHDIVVRANKSGFSHHRAMEERERVSAAGCTLSSRCS